MTQRAAPMFKPIFATLLAVLATLAHAQTEPLVQRDLSDRDSRFIELPQPGKATAFRAKAGVHSITFDTQGVQVADSAGGNGGAGAGIALQSIGVHPGLRYTFAGGAAVAPVGLQPSQTEYHWLVGPQAEWLTHLQSFGGLAYRSVWPGIDAVFKGDSNGFKYQFEVAQGANPGNVWLTISGAQAMRVTPDGALEWQLNGAVLRDAAPMAYQLQGGKRVLVPAAYRVEQVDASTWRVGFALGSYDAQQPLVIDPAWVGYSGLVGGNSGDVVNAVVRAADLSTWACGTTRSTNLNATSGTSRGGNDAFVARFAEDGSALSVTYMGGSGDDSCRGIALDPQGNVFVTGGTDSTNFAMVGTPAAGAVRSQKATSDLDAFVARLSDASTITWSGFVGGTGDDQANAIAVDGAGRATIAGYTSCVQASVAAPCVSPFPAFGSANAYETQNPARQAFAARVAADGQSLEYAGVLSGTGSTSMAYGIALDSASGTAVVVGETNSAADLPAAAGFRQTANTRPASDDAVGDAADGFAARINAAGSNLDYFTLLTGTNNGTVYNADRAFAVKLLADGSAMVAGETSAGDFPANASGVRVGGTPGNTLSGSMDAYLLHLNASGTDVSWARYVGGAGYDSAEAVGFARDGYFVLANTTTNTAVPTPAVQAGLLQSAAGGQDGLLVKYLFATGAVDYTGYLGSSLGDAFYALDANVVDVSAALPAGRTILSVGGGTTATGTSFFNPQTNRWSSDEVGRAAGSGLVLRIDPFGPPDTLAAQDNSGTQSTVINTAFADLKVLVSDAQGQPVPRINVIFTSPVSTSPSITAAPTATAKTDANGVATLSGVLANGFAGGPYTVTATAGGKSTAFTLTNTRAAQAALTATATPNPIAYNTASTLGTTGGTGSGAVTFALDAADLTAANYCTLAANTVTAKLAGGSCSIIATKAGDANYTPASATVVVSTTKAAQTGFAAQATPAAIEVNGLSVLSTTGGQSTAQAVFVVAPASSAVCVLESATQLRGLTAGTCTLTATKPADSNYYETNTPLTVNVSPTSPGVLVVTATPPAVQFGQSATLSATANSSTGAVTYTAVGPCTVSGASLATTGVGACVVTGHQAADANYLATTGSTTVAISKAAQTPLQLQAPNTLAPGGSGSLAATGGSSGEAVVFSIAPASAGICAVSGNTLQATAVGVCTVEGTMPGGSNYLDVSASIAVTIANQAQAALTLSASSTQIAMDSTSALSVTGGSGTGSVTYALVSGAPYCDVDGVTGIVTGKAIGACTVNATKAASLGYDAITSANTVTIHVGKKAQNIVFTLPAGPMVLVAADVSLVASTDGVSLTVSQFTSKSPVVCEVQGSQLKFYTAGTCTVTASQAGDATYLPAEKDASVPVVLPDGTATTVTGTVPAGSIQAVIPAGSAWVFAPAGTGPLQTSGFIAMAGHPKSPGVAPPASLRFVAGLFDFVALNGPKGSTFTTTITYPGPIPANAQYWMFGATADNPAPHWYRFTGASFSGNTVTLTITDGGLGDSDLTANSIIVDPGGVAFDIATLQSTPVPTLGALAIWLLSALMLLCGAGFMARRHTLPSR